MNENAPATPLVSGLVDGKPTFVGRWAVAAADCGSTAWTMTAEQLQSPGPMACTISKLSPTLAGYIVNSGCSEGGTQAPGRVMMTLSGGPPVSAMTLTGGPFAEPLTLVRCPA